MKHLNGLVQKDNVELILPISDGQSFVFSFPASACKKANEITISLYFENCCMYRINSCLSAKKPTESGYGNGKFFYGWLGDDSPTMVFRISKISPDCFNTYVNDQVIHNFSRLNRDKINDENRIDTAGVAINSLDVVPFTLTVFEQEEYENVEAFSTAMRNPESSDFQMKEGLVFEETEKESCVDGGDGTNLPSIADIRPQDTKWMKYSSTMVWPIAIELEAANSKGSLQQRHDKLMCEWLVGHGDNTTIDTHDYFIHSHSVAWPKALMSVNVDKAEKIRERHGQLFKNLP
ncbi:hypothetical protein GALMADRAFT_245195 [Galerina marginata CBS 339.88]|uniref:Uncharacterized protein n=1 Tax=Galerina marginata (strain CBS 339.88) TaxID=685588 RepID=A0A067TE31_GALM3|nr:hypothetical protein GALMADRAFT_245195 [Galerina marginata CBS 339.88]